MAISTAVDQSAVARVVGIKTDYINLRGGVTLLPQRIAVVGQGSSASTYSTTKSTVTSAAAVGATYGYGSPLHLACKQLLPANGDGVGTIPVTVFPLDDDGSGVASVADITVLGPATANGTLTVSINNISVTISIADETENFDIIDAIVAAVNAELSMPVIATSLVDDVILTAKWAGASSNDIFVAVDNETAGVTATITQATGGVVNPDVQDALDQIGNVWETLVLNCMDVADTTTLDTFQTFGEGRWGALTKKPLIVFSGSTESDRATATTLTDSRKDDRINSQLTFPGSDELPFVAAAGGLARIAKVANNTPANDYGSQSVSYIEGGTDGEQWLYADKDLAVKSGCSTTDIRDGVVTLSDTVTMYHPTGEEPPAYRYVCDIIKAMNVIFNLDLIFNTTDWDGKPLIPDDQPTSNSEARKPKAAKAAVASMIDSLGLEAIISDPETAKGTIQAGISSTNPKRLDVAMTIQLAGNANIISIDFNFGFYFGTQTVIG